MEGFGIEKLTLVLVIVLVLFGARRIPEIGASVGKGIREFKRGLNDAAGDTGSNSGTAHQTASSTFTEPMEPSVQAQPKRLLR